MNVKEHLDLLGLKVEDKVTGFNGTVTYVCFDLYGCVQALINPGMDENKLLRDSTWFDTNRIKVLDKTPVMERPNLQWNESIDEKGPEKKPFYKV
jgi:hypothetical protein